jgi:hypothetical protein
MSDTRNGRDAFNDPNRPRTGIETALAERHRRIAGGLQASADRLRNRVEERRQSAIAGQNMPDLTASSTSVATPDIDYDSIFNDLATPVFTHATPALTPPDFSYDSYEYDIRERVYRRIGDGAGPAVIAAEDMPGNNFPPRPRVNIPITQSWRYNRPQVSAAPPVSSLGMGLNTEAIERQIINTVLANPGSRVDWALVDRQYRTYDYPRGDVLPEKPKPKKAQTATDIRGLEERKLKLG